jgi:microsomal prostaglandin-E synthase 2
MVLLARLFSHGWKGNLSSQLYHQKVLSPRFFSTPSTSIPTTSSSPLSLVLYQYQICPFCNRVKAFLDYNKIRYETVEVNPITKKQIKFSGFKKVPLVTMKQDNHTMEDSMKILEYIRDSSIFSKDQKMRELWTDDTEKWAKWSELKLAIILYPNITGTFSDSWKAFRYCEDISSWSATERLMNRYLGPVAMYLASSKIKKKYGIVDEKKELDESLKEWTDAVGSNQFLHGDNITLPDLMVFGVLRGIQDLPVFATAMERNSALESWYNRVKLVIDYNIV